MKKQLLSLAILICTTVTLSAQSYTFGIVPNYNDDGNYYEYTFVITPDFTDPDPQFADMQLALVISNGNTYNNFTSILGPSFQQNTAFNAAFITGQGAGDGTLDIWSFILPSPMSSLTTPHTTGVGIPIFSFEVANSPNSGTISILDNNDAISTTLGGNGFNVDNFINIDLGGGSGTQNLFGSIDAANSTHPLFNPLLNVGEVDTLGNIKISPNPVVTNFTIQGATSQIDEVKIFDINGGLVKEIAPDAISEAISIKDLSAGVYFVRLSSQGTVSAIKLIKE